MVLLPASLHNTSSCKFPLAATEFPCSSTMTHFLSSLRLVLGLFSPRFILGVWKKVAKYFHPGFSPAKAGLPVSKRMHGHTHVWERSITSSARFQKGVTPGSHTVSLPSQALQQQRLLVNMPQVRWQRSSKTNLHNVHHVQCPLSTAQITEG